MNQVLVLASPIVDWTAMWKICLVALAAGAGVVIFFGFMLLGLRLSQGPATHDIHEAETDGTHTAAAARTPSEGARIGGFTLALVCGLIVVGVIAVGVYAMVNKPSSKPAPAKSSLVVPAGSRPKLIASLR